MQVASTRESLVLVLKNDKNSERWEEFVNQYYILPDSPQFDSDFTEDEFAKKVRYGLKWRIFELEKGKRFRNYLLSVLKNVARSLCNKRKDDRLVFVDGQRFEGGVQGDCPRGF